MDKFHTIETNIFFSFILVMIIIVISVKQQDKSFSTKLFLLMCWSCVVLLIVDMLPWLTDGIPGEGRKWIPYTANLVLFIIQPIPLILWLCYVDFLLYKSTERLKKLWFYIHPFIFTSGIMIYSAFTDYVFLIDDNNVYQRGPGIIIITATYLVLILFQFYLAFRHRHSADKNVLTVVVLFGIIPLIASVIQILCYGISIIWPSVALIVIFVYIFLETQREIRDYLTGLLNRQQIDSVIQSRINDYGRKGGFSLIMIDLDRFKEINDQYGHDEGDNALIQLAMILNSAVKSTDKAARFGGDEFLLLIDNSDPQRITEIINRIQLRIDNLNMKKREPYNIAISAGFSVYSPDKYKGFTDLLHDVDQKMYQVKKQHRMKS